MIKPQPKLAGVIQLHVTNRLLKRADVELKTGLSRSSIYSAIRARAFPEPIQVGPNRVAWLEAEIDQWIAARLNERNAATEN